MWNPFTSAPTQNAGNAPSAEGHHNRHNLTQEDSALARRLGLAAVISLTANVFLLHGAAFLMHAGLKPAAAAAAPELRPAIELTQHRTVLVPLVKKPELPPHPKEKTIERQVTHQKIRWAKKHVVARAIDASQPRLPRPVSPVDEVEVLVPAAVELLRQPYKEAEPLVSQRHKMEAYQAEIMPERTLDRENRQPSRQIHARLSTERMERSADLPSAQAVSIDAVSVSLETPSGRPASVAQVAVSSAALDVTPAGTVTLLRSVAHEGTPTPEGMEGRVARNIQVRKNSGLLRGPLDRRDALAEREGDRPLAAEQGEAVASVSTGNTDGLNRPVVRHKEGQGITSLASSQEAPAHRNAGSEPQAGVTPTTSSTTIKHRRPEDTVANAAGDKSLVTRAAVATHRVRPEIPDSLRQQAFKGSVLVEVTIEANGAHQVRMIEGSGNAEMDRIVLECLRRWRWSNALQNGKPARDVERFQFDFLVR